MPSSSAQRHEAVASAIDPVKFTHRDAKIARAAWETANIVDRACGCRDGKGRLSLQAWLFPLFWLRACQLQRKARFGMHIAL